MQQFSRSHTNHHPVTHGIKILDAMTPPRCKPAAQKPHALEQQQRGRNAESHLFDPCTEHGAGCLSHVFLPVHKRIPVKFGIVGR
jgi:hypothetical protein